MKEDRARKVKRLFQPLSDDAAVAVDYINDAVLQALATNPRLQFKFDECKEAKDLNHVYIPSYIPILDSNGNYVTHIPRLLRRTNLFIVEIKEERLTQILQIALVKEEVANFYIALYDFAEVKISLKEDGKVYVGFFMKKSTYSTEEEEQTMPKYVYKLNPVPTGASEKAVVSAYYTTEEAAETARECLWANGEISVKSDITRLTIDTDPPKYKGVILKAELRPPEHKMYDWHIDDSSRIEPISYEDYARLRYPDAKDEFQEQELIDADNPADLKEWLPYISPEDNCGKRFFYVYFPDKMFRFARHSKGNVVLMVSDAYEKFLKRYQRQVLGFPYIHIPGSEIPWNITPTDYNERQEPAKDIRDKYPDILMVKFSYPGCVKSRRDFQAWNLLKVWQYSKVVWSLDPKTLTDTVGDLNIGVVIDDGVIADVDLSYLFNVEDSLPLVVFGRDEVFLFVRYRKLTYDDDKKAHQFFVVTTIKEVRQNGTFRLRKVG